MFETLLVLDGAPIELDAHLERLRSSVRELYGAEPPAALSALLRERASSLPLGRLRVTLAPAAGGVLRADSVATAIEPDEPFPSWDRAITLRALTIDGGLGAHKWADRGALARIEAHEPKGSLPLVLDRGGEVLEASRANVFAIENGVLVTPAADGRILPGIARARVIEAARSLGLDLREGTLDVGRLGAADEAFLTGSVRGVEPVRSVGTAELEPPGEAAAAISAELRRSWLGVDTIDAVPAP